MICITITFFIFAITLYFYYIHFLKPKRISQWYQHTLESLGYKIITLPFQPLKIALANIQKYNQKQHNDAFYDQKKQWHNYDIVLTNTGNIITLILLKPLLLRSFFSPDKQPLFVKTLSNKVAFNLVLKNSLILNQQDQWKRKRKIFTDILNFDFILKKIPKMVEICSNIFQQIEQQSKQQIKNNSYHFKTILNPYFEQMITQIVIKLFFGSEVTNLTINGIKINKQLSSILAQARNQSYEWPVLIFGQYCYKWFYGSKYITLNNRIILFRNQIKTILQKKLQKLANKQLTSYGDLFEALIYLKQQQKATKQTIQIDQYISQFCAFLTASTDTTGNYINMLSFYLAKNKSSLDQLKIQLKNKFKNISQIKYHKLKQIQYLEWCQLQTTRMYGPATSILLRQAKQDTYLENIPILQSTGIKIEMLASHYNNKFYTDPHVFNPYRWEHREIDPFAFGGFGGGSHSCIGKHLAMVSSKIIIAVMLLRYQNLQIVQEEKITMIYQGIYKPTPFYTILTKKIKQKEQLLQEKTKEIDRARFFSSIQE